MNKDIRWEVNSFEELSVETLYKILHFRTEVFVLEQDSPYQDLDFKDQEALHLIAYSGVDIVAYSRIFPPHNNVVHYGRVLVVNNYRNNGFGHQLINKVEEVIKSRWFTVHKIEISAQLYLQKFYESHGYICTSKPYDLEQRLHIDMVKNATLK